MSSSLSPEGDGEEDNESTTNNEENENESYSEEFEKDVSLSLSVGSDQVVVSVMSTIQEEQEEEEGQEREKMIKGQGGKDFGGGGDGDKEEEPAGRVEDEEDAEDRLHVPSPTAFGDGFAPPDLCIQNKPGPNETRVPDELKDLEFHFEGADIEEESSSNNKTQDSTSSEVEELLKKLDMLQRTQTMLEQVLDADSGQEDVEKVLQEALANLPTGGQQQQQTDEAASLSQEMSALKRLLEEETSFAEGEDEKIQGSRAGEHVGDRDRNFQQILQEYEELERTLESCDEQESIRSESEAQREDAYRVSETGKKSPIDDDVVAMASPSSPVLAVLEELEKLTTTTTEESSSSSTHRSSAGKKLKLDPGSQGDQTIEQLTRVIDAMGNNQKSRTRIIKKKSPYGTRSVPSLAIHSGLNVKGATKYAGTPRPRAKESQSTSSSVQQPQKSGFEFLAQASVGPGFGAGEGVGNITTESQKSSPDLDLEFQIAEKDQRIAKLKADLANQENLLQAFQEDNQKIYSQLREKEVEYKAKEADWEELVASLKNEIATLKIQRLGPLASSPVKTVPQQQKQELERLRDESVVKSAQIDELRQEIADLKKDLNDAEKAAEAKQLRSPEKEKDYQKQIRNLNKQIRTLQKILYNKDPTMPLNRTASVEDVFNMSKEMGGSLVKILPKEPQIAVMEARIVELEGNLAQADADAKERLRDFQSRLISLKEKYEDQMREYDLQLQHSATKIASLEHSLSQSVAAELQEKIDRGQSEINALKHDIGKYKRELDIAQKSSIPWHSKQDAGTLAIAIKSFKSEMADKDKEIIKLRKEIADLIRTNNSLKREREKYLTALAQPRVALRATTTSGNIKTDLKSTKGIKGSGSLILRSPSKMQEPASNPTAELLQSALEYERSEFEQMLTNKKKEIEDRDKLIHKLRTELSALINDPSTHSGDTANTKILLDDLRSRVNSQNELIVRLKEYVSRYKKLEDEHNRLKQKYREDVTRIKQLQDKLEVVKNLNKPENEVLSFLAQKFDDVNSRYLQREQQIEALLNRLSLGGPISLSETRSEFPITKSSSSSPSPASSDLDLRQLSPSVSVHLFAKSGNTDLPEV